MHGHLVLPDIIGVQSFECYSCYLKSTASFFPNTPIEFIRRFGKIVTDFLLFRFKKTGKDHYFTSHSNRKVFDKIILHTRFANQDL